MACERLAADKRSSQCGLRVIGPSTDEVVHSLQSERSAEELFEAIVLPGVRPPGASGSQEDVIDRRVRCRASRALPRASQTTRGLLANPGHEATEGAAPDAPIKYQLVFQLTPGNLRLYEHMSAPSLTQRWLTQPRRGELLGVSASVGGAMVGFAVAELFAIGDAEPMAELISLRVLPAHAQGDMQARLVSHLQKLVGRPLGR